MFQRTFPSVLILADSTMKLSIDKFRFEYTVSHLKRSGRRHALTDEERTALSEQESGMSARQLTQQN